MFPHRWWTEVATWLKGTSSIDWSEAGDFCHLPPKNELDVLHVLPRNLKLGNQETWVIRKTAVMKGLEAAFETWMLIPPWKRWGVSIVNTAAVLHVWSCALGGAIHTERLRMGAPWRCVVREPWWSASWHPSVPLPVLTDLYSWFSHSAEP